MGTVTVAGLEKWYLITILTYVGNFISLLLGTNSVKTYVLPLVRNLKNPLLHLYEHSYVLSLL